MRQAIDLLGLYLLCLALFLFLDTRQAPVVRDFKLKGETFHVTLFSADSSDIRLLHETVQGMERYLIKLKPVQKGRLYKKFVSFESDSVQVMDTRVLQAGDALMLDESSGEYDVIYSLDQELVRGLREQLKYAPAGHVSLFVLCKVAAVEWLLLVALLFLWRNNDGVQVS